MGESGWVERGGRGEANEFGTVVVTGLGRGKAAEIQTADEIWYGKDGVGKEARGVGWPPGVHVPLHCC